MAADAPKAKILAPAGDRNCFLAALAAGADSIYVGLKKYSARMEAVNFSFAELNDLTALAHENNCQVLVALNTLVKQEELENLYDTVRLLDRIDGIIIQDPALFAIAAQTGFEGSITLSTLANVSSPSGLAEAQKMGASRVVLPRELSIDEMRQMGEQCPEGLELECFIHGALCYCVSGRCYWSSYLGGKSGLRGRCVQPCRRVYAKAGRNPKAAERHFACQDLELGPLVKLLGSIPNLRVWKIEGRKKGPHYVFYTVTAYKMLRDNPEDPQVRKTAAELLGLALGRPGVKARFLANDKYLPMAPDRQTSSGLLAGKVIAKPDGSCMLKPRFELFPKDYLRIGVEDERWHAKIPVACRVPKGGTLRLKLPKHKTPPSSVPVYLIDRRDPELSGILKKWEDKLTAIKIGPVKFQSGQLKFPTPVKPRKLPDMLIAPNRKMLRGAYGIQPCLWLAKGTLEGMKGRLTKLCLWLPPVIWPDEEVEYLKLITIAIKNGATHFVCNAPWQRGLFPARLPKAIRLIAGPFCNAANSLAMGELKNAGFCAAFASPELPEKELLALPAASPLPIGLVMAGFWPVGLSRFGLAGLKSDDTFSSPRGEVFWARNYGESTWLYPAWPLDLAQHKKILQSAGYSFFATFLERPPQNMPEIHRPGLFNWAGVLA